MALIVLPVMVMAQKRQFRFFSIPEIELQNQALIGRLGSHFFVFNLTDASNLNLYMYDTSVQKGETRVYDLPRPLSAINVQEHSILFSSVTPGSKGTEYHFLELDERGEVLQKKEGMLNVWKGLVNTIASPDKKYMLFYQFRKTLNDSMTLRGSLLDRNGNLQKQMDYAFKQDSVRDTEPELFLDIFGNTHILVFDKFANYRLSTDLTVNTIPIGDEHIFSETFSFEKVKLKTMRISQNNACKCLQAEGVYIDGSSKLNKGIYSIVLPAGRGNELVPRFIPFSHDMIKSFRKGFSATDETILRSVQLQEIAYSDSGSFAILRLNAGMLQRTQGLRPLEDLSPKAINPIQGLSRAGEYMAQVSSGRSSRTPVVLSQPPPNANATQSVGSSRMSTESSATSPLTSRSSSWNAPKLICLKLENEKGFEWTETKTLDVFAPAYQVYNRLFLVPGEDREISALLYQADRFDEPQPVFVTLKDGQQTIQKIPEKKLLFYPLLFLDRQQYASLYRNTETGSGGLMVISQP